MRLTPQGSRLGRRALAWALTVLTTLQALTLVVAAVKGGPTDYALMFLATGIVVALMMGATMATWRWARSSDLPVILTESEPREHRGLTGRQTPPTRW